MVHIPSVYIMGMHSSLRCDVEEMVSGDGGRGGGREGGREGGRGQFFITSGGFMYMYTCIIIPMHILQTKIH